MMRIVFCGTPSFAVPSLKHLLAQKDFELLGVITQPDRPRGRGQQVSFSPVKEVACAANIPVHQPEKIRAPEVQEWLQGLALDCIVIIAYGQIIPAGLLAVAKLGWINLHASLLPKYRGAAPINWAIAEGESKTGLTTMRIDAGMDTGDILLQRELEIAPAWTALDLAQQLALEGAPLITETLRRLKEGTIEPRPQDHSQATYAPILKKDDGRINWTSTAGQIQNRMRGFVPWPGTYSSFRGQSCHLLGEPVSDQLSDASPGTIFPGKNELLVMCGNATVLRLLTVKLEGRKQVSAAEFANGARLKSGERFR